MFQFFFFLLAFEFAHLIHGTSEICSRQYSEKIKECHAQKFDTTKNCSVQSSRHQKFSCNCLIEDPSKFGKWELKIIFSNKLNNPVTEYFDIYNHTTVPTLPSGGFVFARVGKFVRIYMDQPSYDKKAECHAYYQGKWMYNLHKNISDEDVELYGICGIQMRVRDDREGEWSLHQVQFTAATFRYLSAKHLKKRSQLIYYYLFLSIFLITWIKYLRIQRSANYIFFLVYHYTFASFPSIMIRFLFLSLAFAHFVHGINPSVKEIISRPYDEKIYKCSINKLNLSENCVVKESYYRKLYVYNNCHCSKNNNESFEFGTWEIKIIFQNKSINRPITEYVDLYNNTAVSALPGRYIYAEIGKYVRIYMDQPSDNESAKCFAHHQEKWTYNLLEDIVDDDIDPYGTCGIQMRVQENRKGEWSLRQVLGHAVQVANFTIIIKRQFHPNQPLPRLMIGEESEIVSNIYSLVTIRLKAPPGKIEECHIGRNNLIYSKNKAATSCEFKIVIIDDSYYGKWTFTTVYRNENTPQLLKLLNEVYIYKSIKEEIVSPYSFVYAHVNATFDLSLKNSVNESDYEKYTCRLVHKISGMEYNLTESMKSIYLVDSACCRVRITMSKKKYYGEWYIERRSRSELKKAYFYITNPLNETKSDIDYPCKTCKTLKFD